MTDSKESQISENKASLSEWKDGVISLAAFSTSGGATVHFGIDDQGERIGVHVGRNSIENLANDIRRNTDPPLFPSIVIDDDGSSTLIHVTIEESPIKPVWAFGKPYKRVGRTNQSLTRNEVSRLEAATTGNTWDGLPCIGLKESDLGRDAVENYLRRAQLEITTPTETVLDNLRLRLPDGSLCNAAAILFATTPSRFLDGVQVKCGRFRGNSPIDFIDERTLYGNVLTQLDDALSFISRNTRQAIVITGRPEREVVPEYPDVAIREAIINALCDRDYAATGHIQVRIFDVSLEVWNPATLPHGMTVEQLYGPHPSRPRNRKLAEALYRARLIEQWGTGTLRMAKACKDYGLSEPEYQLDEYTFVIRFAHSVSGTRPAPTNEIVLTARQIQTLEHVRQKGSIASSDYVTLFGVSRRQAQVDLAKLVELGLLETRGVNRATHFVASARTY